MSTVPSQITIPASATRVIKQRYGLLRDLYENISANSPIVLEREDFSILDDKQWKILAKLIHIDVAMAVHDPDATLYTYNKIMQIFKVMEKYSINLKQMEEICTVKDLYDEMSETIEDMLEPYTLDDVKPVADYIRLGEIQTGGKRRKTRKQKK